MTCVSCGAETPPASRFCPSCGSPQARDEAPRQSRKNVVILFTDIVDSTGLAERLDAERLRETLNEYYDACVRCVSDHGGTIEKFIGDAVMAVFGVPKTHDDDGLRAVSTAARIHDEVRRIGSRDDAVTFAVRSGISSGEVIATSYPNGDFRVIGDAVNTAARLQTAAAGGRILIEDTVAAMVRRTVDLEPLEDLRLRGKSAPVRAWEVRSLHRTAPCADRGVLVGRAKELDQLVRAYQRAVARRRPDLVTVVGEAGVGKSRLLREFTEGCRSAGTEVLFGHCPSFGSADTFAAVVEMVEGRPGGWPGVERLLGSEDDGARAVRTLRRLTGRVAGDDGPPVDEASWAVRRLLACLARRKPLVVVVEDAHHASVTLHTVVREAVTWLPDLPLLVVCAGRLELLDAGPSWHGAVPPASTLVVGSLGVEDLGAHLSNLVSRHEVAAHAVVDTALIARAAEGNPLIAELMLDVVREHGELTTSTPSIQILLVARLDQLPREEREVVERAAVIGRTFATEDVCTCFGMGAEGEVRERLISLADRGILRREPNGRVFSFAQELVREVLYTTLPKRYRAEWHLDVARMLERRRTRAGELNGIGDHRERAYLLLRDIRPNDDRIDELRVSAADALTGEGMRSLRRKDLSTAASLLERARKLVAPWTAQHARLSLWISDCWTALADADRALDTVALFAAASDDRASRPWLEYEVQRLTVSFQLGRADRAEITGQVAGLRRAVGRAGQRRLAWSRFHELVALLDASRERMGAAEDTLRLALGSARSIDDEYEVNRILVGLGELALWGRTPVRSGMELCEELCQRSGDDRGVLASVLTTRAGLLALRGDINAARSNLAQARLHIGELHLSRAEVVADQVSGIVESLAGDHERARRDLSHGAAVLERGGALAGARTMRAWAARAEFESGNTERAAVHVRRFERIAGELDLRTRLILGALTSRLAERKGDLDRAVRVAESTLAEAGLSDDIRTRGDITADLARVLASAGRTADARERAAQAADLYVAKGADLLVSRIRAWRARCGVTSGRGENRC